MAYQIINAPASHDALVSSLITFLVGAGWTNLGSGSVRFSHDPGSGSRNYDYNIATSGSGDAAWIRLTAEPGSASGPAMSVKAGAMTRAWLFAGSTFCHVIVEVAPGYFSSMHFGFLSMAFSVGTGESTGSFIASGYESTSYEWRDIVAYPSGRLSLTSGLAGSSFLSSMRLRMKTVSGEQWSGTSSSPSWRTNCHRTFNAVAESPLCPLVMYPRTDGSRPLMPVNLYGEHSPTQSPNYFLYGSVPNLRALYFHDIAPATELDIGGDTWIAFPILGQNPSVTAISGNQQFGIAIKKET